MAGGSAMEFVRGEKEATGMCHVTTCTTLS
jgi:hypothetical protein